MKRVPEVKRRRALPSVACLVAAQMVGGVAAAGEAEEAAAGGAFQLKPISVTAEKVSSTDQETPVSMTVISGEDLERSAAAGTADVVRQVPNMHMTKAGQHASVAFLSMRGVTPFMEGEQPVGFFIDGVHRTNIDTEMLDIDRVEVLRGPQSTLYGRNTEAGAVNIVTRDPEPFEEGTVSLGVGNYARRTASAILGGPVGNRDWSYRAAVQVLDTDGFFTRRPDGIRDVDDATDLNARMKLRWKPDDTWDVVATYDGQRYREGSTNIALLSQLRARPRDVYADYIGSNDTDIHGGSLRATYDGPSFSVTSLSSYTDETKSTTYDVDATPANLLRLRTDVDYARFTQELRFSSPKGASGLRWIGGLYYFDQRSSNNFDMDMTGMGFAVQSARTQVDTRNMAAFGQVTWGITDTVDLIGGLRYDHERKDVTSRQYYTPAFVPDYRTDRRLSFHAWLPKLGVEYRPAPGVMTFASYSEGYKAGGFNNLGTPGRESFDAEYTRNYEAGVKYTGFDNRLQAKLSLFWIDWTDQQVEQNILTVSNISNAGKSVSRGVEVEAAWQATQALVLRAGAGWNDAHFTEYTDDRGDYSGKRPPNAPAYTYSVAADYSFDSGLYAHADWTGSGHLYYDVANTQKEGHYGLLNLKAGYRFGSYEAAAWIKNALDEVYATRAFDVGGGTYAGIAGDPRTFDVTLTARW